MKKLTETFEEIYAEHYTTELYNAEACVKDLINAVREYNKQAVGEDVEIPSNVEHPHYQRYVEDTLTQNSMKDEIRQRQEELI